MGYEDSLHNAELSGEAISELITNLNETEFYSDELIIAYVIKGLLKQFTDEGRRTILAIVDELLEED